LHVLNKVHYALRPGAWRCQALFFAAAAVVTVSIVAYCVTQSESGQQTSNAEPAATARHAQDVFGPGAWTGNTAATWRTPPQIRDPEEKLGVDDRRQLLVNSALLDTINHYLLDQAGDRDEDDLKDYLKGKLPQTAYAQAVQIIDRYQAYMQRHDEFLAAQNLQKIDTNINPLALSAADIQRIAEWAVQRNRLRQSQLGADVTQAWYQNDDASLRQALDELQQRSNGASTQSTAAAPVPHWSNKSEEEQHVRYLLGLLRNAMTGFSQLKPAGA
jgi:hypothetical protein